MRTCRQSVSVCDTWFGSSLSTNFEVNILTASCQCMYSKQKLSGLCYFHCNWFSSKKGFFFDQLWKVMAKLCSSIIMLINCFFHLHAVTFLHPWHIQSNWSSVLQMLGIMLCKYQLLHTKQHQISVIFIFIYFLVLIFQLFFNFSFAVFFRSSFSFTSYFFSFSFVPVLSNLLTKTCWWSA